MRSVDVLKKAILATTMIGSVLLLGACSSNETIAKVGNDSITKEQLYKEMKTAKGAETLQSMIETEVLTQKYKVTEKEVKDEIENLKKKYPSEEEFKATLTQNNINTDEQLNKVTKDSLLRFKALSDGVKVTDKDLETFYEQNKDKYLTIDASHILVEKQDEAEKILKELKNGAKFDEMAKKHSKDGSAIKGGELGTFGKGSMVKEFEEAAFALKENEMSNVVKTQFGYHIIKVNKIIEKNLKNNKDEIKQDYLVAKGNYPKAMSKLLKDAKVEIKDKDFKDAVQQRIDQYDMSAQNPAKG
ncbi:peptidylprolyl isomerase [Bacillus cereus]|nr:peptidylprolyl isomerase [Bacillus cereus]